MPSIPQSLLWISLVVLWLFVLVPMLISKRDAVRRTSDVALATRVLTSGAGARLLKRGGPANGHRSDPHWRADDDEDDDLEEDRVQDAPRPDAAVVTAREPDYLDVDVVEDEPLPDDEQQLLDERQDQDRADEPFQTEDVDDDGVEAADDDEYDYDYAADDGAAGPAREQAPTSIAAASRRRRYDTATAAAVSARKYRFRKRALLVMAAMLLVSAAAAFMATPSAWWVCGAAGAVTVLYLGYLRRQTRIEEQVRRRRAHRMARSRLGVENTNDRDLDIVPARLRRPGAVVLDIDDEDPVFEHLDRAPFAREQGWTSNLPRAAGQ